MLVVCDTNVFVSALVFPGGTPDRIVKGIIARRVRNAASPDLLSELREVLHTKLKLPAERSEQLVQLVAEMSELTYPTIRLAVVRADESDNRVIECAVTAQAQYLITGDKKHLIPLKKHGAVQIVSPMEFARIVGFW